MRYVKLNEQGGVTADAPVTLTVGGMVHYHPSGELYEIEGWLRYIDTPMPENDPGEGMMYSRRTADDGEGNCVVSWEIIPVPPVPPEPAASFEDRLANVEEALNIILEVE